MKKVIIVGGGASGLLAASLIKGCEVLVLEKNERTGKKLYITGKGRCNLTNACDSETFMSMLVSNPRFMYSAFNRFNNYDVMDFFEAGGVKLKIERGNRVFPESDRAGDIVNALDAAVRKNGGVIRKNAEVTGLVTDEYDEKPGKTVKGVKLADGSVLPADFVVIATGGLSYPTTGSTGDGYRFAKSAGHTVTKLYPSLAGFHVKENFCADMAGLTLKNVRAEIIKTEGGSDKEIYSGFGELMFTHKGVSGPLMLTACADITDIMAEGSDRAVFKLNIDLKPALDEEKLDERLVREFEKAPNKKLANVLRSLLPESMIPVFAKKLVKNAGPDSEKSVNAVTAEERKKIACLLKCFDMTLAGTAGYNEAVVTKGGVSVKEINPKTMESKLCSGLYFAGEVIDVDAYTGGFNLQIAFSTAAAAAGGISDRAE